MFPTCKLVISSPVASSIELSLVALVISTTFDQLSRTFSGVTSSEIDFLKHDTLFVRLHYLFLRRGSSITRS